jgi:spore maturation protein CgeB
MRVLLIGSDNPWRMEAAVERALKRAGHETLLIDDRRTKRIFGRGLTQRWAVRRAKSFRPDFVFLSKCLALDPETVAAIILNRKNAMWYHDPQWHRDTDRPDIAHIVTIGKLAATFFVTGFVAEWRAHELPTKYLPAAGDRDIAPVAPRENLASDVAFIGTGYDLDRARLLVRVAKHYHLRVWGAGWEEWGSRVGWTGRSVEGKEFAGVCSSSKITLGVNPSRAVGGRSYTSDRTWMSILGGAFYLGQRTPGITALLVPGTHCEWYDGADECIEQCGRYIRDEDARARIREEGERFVRANHTYDQRVANLLEDREFVNPL